MTQTRWQFSMGSAMAAIALTALGLASPAHVQVFLLGVGLASLVVIGGSLGFAWASCTLEDWIERLRSSTRAGRKEGRGKLDEDFS